MEQTLVGSGPDLPPVSYRGPDSPGRKGSQSPTLVGTCEILDWRENSLPLLLMGLVSPSYLGSGT